MAIVFGVDDEDLEPVDWNERMELVDDALWLREQLSNSVVFFDLAVLDEADPATAIHAILASKPEYGALRLKQWGYLKATDEYTRQSIAKLERKGGASALLRYHYGTGALVAAVISAPLAVDHLIRQCMAKHVACVDVVSIPLADESSQIFLST